MVQCGRVDHSEIALNRFDDMYRTEYPRLVAVAAALTGDRDEVLTKVEPGSPEGGLRH